MFRPSRYVAVVVLLVFSVASGAQIPQEKVDLDVVAKIKVEASERSQLMDTLSYLTDVHGPRLTGSPQIRQASEWTKQRLVSWGLTNVQLESWGPFGRGWTLDGFTANMVSPQFFPLIAYPKAWSPSTAGTIKSEAVYLDAKTEADLEKYKGKLRGAIVLISPPREIKALFDPPAQRYSDERLLVLANADGGSRGGSSRFQSTPEQRAARALETKKWQLCQAEGAAVILEPGRGDGGTLFVQSVTLPTSPDTPFDRRPRPWSPDAPAIIPQITVAAEHYNRMVRMIERNTPVHLELHIASRFIDDDLMGYNIVAEIPGTDLKDEVVMLGAHFDSWHAGTGATDNASGSAVCLEAMRVLQAIGVSPRRTIRVALWTGEEQGLLGSRAYVTEHFGRRLTPESGRPNGSESSSRSGADSEPRFEIKPDHAKFAAYFNLDNGTGKIRGVYMQGNELVRPIFRAWLAPFREMGASTLTITNTGGTDHLSFDAVGLPGFQFIQDEVEYSSRTHHSNMDVYDRLQADDLKQAATIMASFAYHAAMRDEKLPRKPLSGAR